MNSCNPCELTISVTAIANAIARDLCDDDDLNLAAAVFTQLGDSLATISAQRAICEKRNNKKDKQEKKKEEQEKNDKKDDKNDPGDCVKDK